MPNADLRLRQQELQLRSEQLRGKLAANARELEHALRRVHAVHSALGWLVQRPYLPLMGLAACVAVLRVRGAVRWLRRVAWVWQGYRQLSRWLDIGGR